MGSNSNLSSVHSSLAGLPAIYMTHALFKCQTKIQAEFIHRIWITSLSDSFIFMISLSLTSDFLKIWIARRDKKAFFSDQCKEIEENSRMGKTRSLQDNWRYQGNISCEDEQNKGQKQWGPNKRREKEEVARILRGTIQKKVLMTWITTMVWSLT